MNEEVSRFFKSISFSDENFNDCILDRVVINNEKYDTYVLKNKLSQAKIDFKLKAQTDGTDKFAYKIDLKN